jgi:hypothetical protein
MQLPAFTTFNEHTFQAEPPARLDDIPKRVNLLTSHFESQVGFLRAHYPPGEAAVQVAIRAEQASNDLRILKAHAGDISPALQAHLAHWEAQFEQYWVVDATPAAAPPEQKDAKAKK